MPVAEAVLCKITKGRHHTKSLLSKIPPNNYQYKRKTFRVAKRRGVTFRLDLHDMVDWYVYYDFGVPAMSTLFSLVKPGDWLIDIGANMGVVSLVAAKKVGPLGKVFAFEPQPDNFQRLTYNAGLNGFTNVTLIQKGLGNLAGTFPMSKAREDNDGLYKIDGHHNPDMGVMVEVVTLDSFVEEVKPPKIDLIKIDVEGYEPNVIRGAIQTLKKFRPTLFVEVVDTQLKEFGESAPDLVSLLGQQGYRIVDSESGEIVNRNSDFTIMRDIVAYPSESFAS